MKWWAIKGPDGEEFSVQRTSRRAWADAINHCDPLIPLYREWYKHDRHDDCVAAVSVLGYRCVEVELAEPGTAENLRRARLAWDALVALGAKVDTNKANAVGRDIAMQTLGEALGRIITDTTAPDGEGEGGKT